MSELLPCPFCGAPAVRDEYHAARINCSVCYARTATKEEWNRRAAAPDQPSADNYEEMFNDLVAAAKRRGHKLLNASDNWFSRLHNALSFVDLTTQPPADKDTLKRLRSAAKRCLPHIKDEVYRDHLSAAIKESMVPATVSAEELVAGLRVARHSYVHDLEHYGKSNHMAGKLLVERVDELLDAYPSKAHGEQEKVEEISYGGQSRNGPSHFGFTAPGKEGGGT